MGDEELREGAELDARQKRHGSDTATKKATLRTTLSLTRCDHSLRLRDSVLDP